MAVLPFGSFKKKGGGTREACGDSSRRPIPRLGSFSFIFFQRAASDDDWWLSGCFNQSGVVQLIKIRFYPYSRLQILSFGLLVIEKNQSFVSQFAGPLISVIGL